MTSPRASGPAPPGADRALGDIVGEVSEKASLLVREEIELAKAELTIKGARLARGAAAGAAAGVFLLFALIYLLHALAYFLGEVLFGEAIWAGYLVVTILLLILGAVAGLVARRFIQRAVPPTPEMAIAEARKTRDLLEEVRH
jgi:hypothetical protein